MTECRRREVGGSISLTFPSPTPFVLPSLSVLVIFLCASACVYGCLSLCLPVYLRPNSSLCTSAAARVVFFSVVVFALEIRLTLAAAAVRPFSLLPTSSPSFPPHPISAVGPLFVPDDVIGLIEQFVFAEDF